MNKEDIRTKVMEELLKRSSMWEMEQTIRAAEMAVDYIYNGTIPPVPIPQAPQQCSPPSASNIPASTKPIRDYYKRP